MSANQSLDSAPDSIDPIVGWRAWRVYRTEDGYRLRSSVVSTRGYGTWTPRERTEAKCYRAAKHDAPGRDCACGIYATSTVKTAREYVQPSHWRPGEWPAIGRVYMWGKIIEHARGWRAQYAYPKQILLPSEVDGHLPGVGINLDEAADELTKAYGVPVLILHVAPIGMSLDAHIKRTT